MTLNASHIEDGKSDCVRLMLPYILFSILCELKASLKVTCYGIWLSFTKEEFVCFSPDLWGAYITPLLVRPDILSDLGTQGVS